MTVRSALLRQRDISTRRRLPVVFSFFFVSAHFPFMVHAFDIHEGGAPGLRGQWEEEHPATLSEFAQLCLCKEKDQNDDTPAVVRRKDGGRGGALGLTARWALDRAGQHTVVEFRVAWARWQA